MSGPSQTGRNQSLKAAGALQISHSAGQKTSVNRAAEMSATCHWKGGSRTCLKRTEMTWYKRLQDCPQSPIQILRHMRGRSMRKFIAATHRTSHAMRAKGCLACFGPRIGRPTAPHFGTAPRDFMPEPPVRGGLWCAHRVTMSSANLFSNWWAIK